MIKVLAIGNSFSQDANRYLNGVCKASGEKIKNVNLYIGGCSLERHFRNIRSEEKAYSFEFAGETTGLSVSIKDLLLSDSWDVITFQQVSGQSPRYETYQPYLDEVCAYVRHFAPKSAFAIHQTWSYEENSDRLCKELHYSHQGDMFADIKKSYDKAAEAIGAKFIIPSGQTMQNMLSLGAGTVHRDTFHAGFGMGRYALALTWMEMLTGKSAIGNFFRDFDVPVSDEQIEIAQKAAHLAADEYRK